MAFKFEYPYIKFLTPKEKQNYQSDLPENLDDLEVFHIKTSVVYRPGHFDPLKKHCYWKPEEYDNLSKFDNSKLWMIIFYLAFGWSALAHCKMYWVNPVKNYIEFSSETWPKYFRRRFHLVGMCGFVLAHMYVFEGRFSNYPKIID